MAVENGLSLDWRIVDHLLQSLSTSLSRQQTTLGSSHIEEHKISWLANVKWPRSISNGLSGAGRNTIVQHLRVTFGSSVIQSDTHTGNSQWITASIGREGVADVVDRDGAL